MPAVQVELRFKSGMAMYRNAKVEVPDDIPAPVLICGQVAFVPLLRSDGLPKSRDEGGKRTFEYEEVEHERVY